MKLTLILFVFLLSFVPATGSNTERFLNDVHKLTLTNNTPSAYTTSVPAALSKRYTCYIAWSVYREDYKMGWGDYYGYENQIDCIKKAKDIIERLNKVLDEEVKLDRIVTK